VRVVLIPIPDQTRSLGRLRNRRSRKHQGPQMVAMVRASADNSVVSNDVAANRFRCRAALISTSPTSVLNFGSAEQLRRPKLWMAPKFFPEIAAFAEIKRLARLHRIETRLGEDVIAATNPVWNGADRIDIESVPLTRSALPPVHGR
jgi:hypothetical protein